MNWLKSPSETPANSSQFSQIFNAKKNIFAHSNPLYYLCSLIFIHWVVSSVGLEHYLDRVGVDGSNPPQPTKVHEK